MRTSRRTSLSSRKRTAKSRAGWAAKSYKDVTAAYGDVTDVSLTLDEPVPDSVRFAYLCVFNSGEWAAIHWGEIHDGRVTFTDMGRDIAYLPMYYINEELVPAGDPFILDTDGSRRPLVGRLEAPVDLSIVSTTRRTQEASTEAVAVSFLAPGTAYELFYWDESWQSLGQSTAGEEPLEFLAPSGALYWLVATDSKREEERIFTYEDGRQVWW